VEAVAALRWVFFLSAVLAFGWALFPYYALRAADKAIGRHASWIGIAAGVALLSALAWLALEVVEFGGRDLKSFLATARLVLLKSSFGFAWLVRIGAAAALVLAALFWPRRLVLLGLSTLVISSEAWIGHGNAGGGVRLAMQLLHLLAASAWLGGLPPLAIVIRKGTRNPECAERARRVLLRFSAMGIAAVSLIAVSGAFITWWAIDEWSLFSDPYLHLLACKVVLFLAMVGVALYNRLRLVPELDSASGPSVLTLNLFWWTVAAEQALAGVVLLIAAVLGMTSP
jgi:putative copper resistance protein D